VTDLLVANAAEVVTSRTDVRGAVGAALRALEVIPDGAVAIDTTTVEIKTGYGLGASRMCSW
jgi:hypothetical protein